MGDTQLSIIPTMASQQWNWMGYYSVTLHTIIAVYLGYLGEELIMHIHFGYKVLSLLLSVFSWQLTEIYETNGTDLRKIAYACSALSHGVLGRVLARCGRYEKWRQILWGAIISILLILSYFNPTRPDTTLFILFRIWLEYFHISIYVCASAYAIGKDRARNRNPPPSPIMKVIEAWNKRQESPLMLDLLESGRHSDMKIISKDGQEFHAHKLILRARNKVFDTMFNHEDENGPVREIRLDDVSAPSVKFLLYFIYSAKIQTPSSTSTIGRLEIITLADVLHLADKFGLNELKNYLEEKFGELCTKEYAWELFRLCKLHNLQNGRKAVFEFMKQNNSELLEEILLAHA